MGFGSEICAFEAKFNDSRRAVLVWRSCRVRKDLCTNSYKTGRRSGYSCSLKVGLCVSCGEKKIVTQISPSPWKK